MCVKFLLLLPVFLPAGEKALCTGQKIIGDADGILAVLPILGKDGIRVAAAGENAYVFSAEGIAAVLAHHLVPLFYEIGLLGAVAHLAGIEGVRTVPSASLAAKTSMLSPSTVKE